MIKILSLNGRLWTRDKDKNSPYYWKTRMKAVQKMIETENPDIICLQEMILPATNYIRNTGKYKVIGPTFHHPIFIRKDFKWKNHKFNVKYDAADITAYGQKYTIINMHSHWNREILEENLNQVSGIIEKNDHVILCGDINNDLRTIKQTGLLKMDSARELLGIGEDQYTFVNFKNADIDHGVIDHFFVKGVVPSQYWVDTYGYGAERLSDHYPIFLTCYV